MKAKWLYPDGSLAFYIEWQWKTVISYVKYLCVPTDSCLLCCPSLWPCLDWRNSKAKIQKNTEIRIPPFWILFMAFGTKNPFLGKLHSLYVLEEIKHPLEAKGNFPVIGGKQTPAYAPCKVLIISIPKEKKNSRKSRNHFFILCKCIVMAMPQFEKCNVCSNAC